MNPFKLWKKGNDIVDDPDDNDVAKSPADVEDDGGFGNSGPRPVDAIVSALMDYEKLPLLSNLTDAEVDDISLMVVKNEHYYGGCEVVADFIPVRMALKVSRGGEGRHGLIDLAKWSQVDPQQSSGWRSLFRGGK